MRAWWMMGVLAALPLSAVADSCLNEGRVPIEVGNYYVASELCMPECLVAIWIYEESNGISGLQRRDEGHDDTCDGQIPPDTLHVSLWRDAP